jgi:molybdopterin converting factor small subunit
LVERYPALGPLAPGLRYAVNEEFASPDRELRDRDTLALVPPVSGG